MSETEALRCELAQAQQDQRDALAAYQEAVRVAQGLEWRLYYAERGKCTS